MCVCYPTAKELNDVAAPSFYELEVVLFPLHTANWFLRAIKFLCAPLVIKKSHDKDNIFKVECSEFYPTKNTFGENNSKILIYAERVRKENT